MPIVSLAYDFTKRAARQILGDEEELSVDLVVPVERHDVGMTEIGDRLGFPLKANSKLSIRGQMVRELLDGHFVTQADVLGEVDLTHSALAELLGDSIVRDRLAEHEDSPSRSVGGAYPTVIWPVNK